MNKLTKIITVISIALGSITMANANPVLIADDDSLSTRICMAASKTSKLRLNSAIKYANLTKSEAVKDIKCNDIDLIDFVEQYSANATAMNDFLTSGQYSETLSASN